MRACDLACRARRLNMRPQAGGASLAANGDGNDPMLRFLFPRLTADPERGADLFALVAARRASPHWYRRRRRSPDTIDGRFAMLATIAALAIVRLERGGDAGESPVGRADRALHRGDGSRASRAGARRSGARQDGAQAGRRARPAGRAVARGGRREGDWDGRARGSASTATAQLAEDALTHRRGRCARCGRGSRRRRSTAIAEGRIG